MRAGYGNAGGVGFVGRMLLCAVLVSGCGDAAVDGTCDPVCEAGLTCVAGACVADMAADASMADLTMKPCDPECTGAKPHCNAGGNCVGCTGDGDCADGQICKVIDDRTANCIAGCNDNKGCAGKLSCCDGNCLETSNDITNCGACGKVCGGNNAAPTCVAGVCGVGMCRDGFGDCNMDSSDGCETALRVDKDNCTACGMGCAFDNGIAGCSNGCYLSSCDFGFEDCNNVEMDGCETSVVSDANNCGGCNTVCKSVPNSVVACENATCAVQSCTQGFFDCDNNGVNGCEVNGATDAKNCGGCGNLCDPGLVCKGGGCTCAQCNIPNASATCINNMCLFDKCNPGFVDCDKNLQNGCEADLQNDSKNCGACNTVCPMNLPACVRGKCQIQTCLNNPKWKRVTCTTPDWVWTRNRTHKTVLAAAANRVLATGCTHGQPQPQLRNGECSLDGKGWVSTQAFPMQGCNSTWYHIGGRHTGNCGGHDGDQWRHLVLGDNDCYNY